LLYFNAAPGDRLEVLDGQQRITSIGRFVLGQISVQHDNAARYFSSLDAEDQQRLLNTELLTYVCNGTEAEIKRWFQVINIAGIQLNAQELLNAIYSGPFVTTARSVLSNSNSPKLQEWAACLKGDPKRQDFLAAALDWMSDGNNDNYMSVHRNDANADQLIAHTSDVINWVNSLFPGSNPYKKGVNWGALYRKHGRNPYSADKLASQVELLIADESVTNKAGVYEYVLGACTDPSLLNVRLFDSKTIATRYEQQNSTSQVTANFQLPNLRKHECDNHLHRQTDGSRPHPCLVSRRLQ